MSGIMMKAAEDATFRLSSEARDHPADDERREDGD